MPYSSNMPKSLSKQQVPVLGVSLVHCIKHLQEYISNLQRNLPALKEIVSSLQKVKEEAQKEFDKVKGQAEYRLMLISSGHAKLTQLLEELEALVKKVEDMRCHNSTEEIIKAALGEKELLQRKVDMQICSIDSFGDLSQIGDEEHSRLRKKHESTEEA